MDRKQVESAPFPEGEERGEGALFDVLKALEEALEGAPSPALQRLIEEVRLGEGAPRFGYDRVYSRHNR